MKSTPALLSHRQHQSMNKDHEAAAKAAKLRYVATHQPGVTRKKYGDTYRFFLNGKQVKDPVALERIRKLAIPPSWTDVWICAHPNGHIQATGSDLNGRKQYRYHADWNSLRNQTKFHKLLEFGQALPKLRQRIDRDLRTKGLTEQKVLATVVELMEQTFIRVGNSGYEKLYGSYGLTTMKDKHVKVGGEKISFTFKGKSGVEHEISVRDKRLAAIVKRCRDIPGAELFQYFTKSGDRRSVDSGMVNRYIQEATAHDFSAKDFRTWAGSVKALECLSQLAEPETQTAAKKHVVEVLDQVANKLGNTRTVCRKYYVHPTLIDLYETGKLQDCLQQNAAKQTHGLQKEEEALMCILRNTCK